MSPQETITRWCALSQSERAALLESLPEPQQEVIALVMEALLDDQAPNFTAIGKELGIDRSRVRRRLDVALRQIAAKLTL